MPTFDRFDIAEAFLTLDMLWNSGGMIKGRKRAISGQLHRIGFKPAPSFNGPESLSENGRDIYAELVRRYFPDQCGYVDCACRDCFNGPIVGVPDVTMCDECQAAGCELGEHECQREDAYAEDDESEGYDDEA